MPLSASPSLLLVLAWDDADLPGRPEGTPARPAALPLLRALAARLPLLAVLPHLPDGARATPGAELPEPLPAASFSTNTNGADPAWPPLATRSKATKAPMAAPKSGVASSNLETENKPASSTSIPTRATAAPGEFLLTAAAISNNLAEVTGYQSRLLGVAEALPAALASNQPTATNNTIIEAATPHPKSLTPTVSLRLSLSQQAALEPVREPAAPYQGRSEETSFSPVLPTAALSLPEATGSGDGPAGTAFLPAVSSSSDDTPLPNSLAQAAPEAEGPVEKTARLSPDSGPELPLYADADDSLAQLEAGPAEAAALAIAPEPEFKPVSGSDDAEQPAVAEPALPAAPARASLAEGLAALAPAPPAGTIPFALADDLHFRIIQFARFAGPLAEAQGQPFGMIYAADWPTWLAALELRYRLRCPLVLHLSALAADQTAPAARGWLLEMERYALRRAQLILVPTEALRERVLARYPLVERVAVVAADDTEGIAEAMADLALIS